MAVVTTHKISLGIIYSFILNPKTSGSWHLGQWSSSQILSMAGLAVVLVVFKKILMAFIVPTGIIDVVQTMRAIGCTRQTACFMADTTFYYCANVTLQSHCCLIIVGAGVGIGPYRMSTAMAPFA